MNITSNTNITVEYDNNTLVKINEMIEKGLDKLESFIKSKTKPNLKFYYEIDSEFDEISSKLEALELWQEHRYFLSIKRMILYIIRENSYNKNFGYCDFALDLLNFFIEMFKTNIEFYKNKAFVSEKDFNDSANHYKKKYREYRRIYYQEIYEPSGIYSEKELYETLKGMRE